MKVRELIASAPAIKCADPQLHLRQIVAAALGWDSTQVFTRWEEELSEEQVAKINAIVQRRMVGEPFQYIVGHEWFWEQKFEVGPGCLIPRRETELLVEECLKLGRGASVVELGAGSGNIGLSVCLERPDIVWHAYEKSPEALVYANRNRVGLKASSYLLYAGDFFEKSASHAPYDAVVSNPPYVTEEELKAVPVEVTHEPQLALSGGRDGLDIIRRLVAAAPKLLKPGGVLMFEIGSGQREASLELLSHWSPKVCLRDYAGLDRLVIATLGRQL